MSAIAFRCRLQPDDDGGYTVTFPDIPHGATQGETVPEALTEAADFLESALAALVDAREDIPQPSKAEPGEYMVSPSATTAAQVALYSTMRRENVAAEELAQRLGLPVGDVRHLIDLAAYPPLPAIERALAALGQRLTVMVEAAE